MDAGGKWVRGPTDWDCPSCRNVNFAKRVTCNRCDAPKPVDAVTAGSYGYPNAGPGQFPMSGTPMGAKPKFTPQVGDWVCPNPSCNNVNWAKRTTCNKCGSLPADSEPAAPPLGKIPPSISPEDWACTNCGNINFARRNECNMCSAPKPVSHRPINVQDSRGYEYPGQKISPSIDTATTKYSIVTNPSSRPGPSRPAAGRETGAVAAKWTPQPGDWGCTNCSNINFHWRDICNKCHSPRSGWPDIPALFTAFPPGYQSQGSQPKKPFKIMKDDWSCPNKECNNINFGRRTTCNRCNAPKPETSATPGAPY